MFELYILEHCPYCKKVRNFLDENEIEYTIIDTSEKSNEEELIRLGGKRQVPFLVDKEHNVMMYESDDIIEYIKSL